MSTRTTGSSRPRRTPNLWPRRIITSTALLAILALLVWGVASIIGLISGSSAPAAEESSEAQSAAVTVQSGDSTITLSSGQEATKDGIVSDSGVTIPRCSRSALAVSAQTSSTSEGAGEKVEVTLTNESEVACFTYAGALSLLIVSGDQTIYDSASCAERDEESTPLLLTPGEAWTGVLEWNGTTYTKGCEAPAEGGPVSGAGTYRAIVSLDGARVTGEEVFVVY